MSTGARGPRSAPTHAQAGAPTSGPAHAPVVDGPLEWPELAPLVDVVLDTPPAARAQRIAELSAGDPRRRAQLEALLADCEREMPLLDAPAAERFGALFAAETRFPDALHERYRYEGEIGRGGMATVYRAHDVKHRRDVAVKVVHPSMSAPSGSCARSRSSRSSTIRTSCRCSIRGAPTARCIS